MPKRVPVKLLHLQFADGVAPVPLWSVLDRWVMVSSRSTGQLPGPIADVAQLVAHHLAKVRVAGSSPVVRSEDLSRGLLGGVAERRGNGLQSRVHGFKSRLHLGATSRGRLAQVASAHP